MEDIYSLAQYLQTIGILDCKSRFCEIFDQLKNLQLDPLEISFQEISFDTRAIFAIADLLKSLTVGDWYDMASRLFLNWESKNFNQKLTRLVEIKQRVRFRKANQAFFRWKDFKKIAFESDFCVPQPQNYVSRNSFVQPVKPSISGDGNPFFESKATVEVVEDPYLFQRLSQPKNSQSVMTSELAKEQKELQFCTFKPLISQKSKQLVKNAVDVVQRLFSQAQEQKMSRLKLRLSNEPKDIHECTFTPKINSKIKFDQPIQERLLAQGAKLSMQKSQKQIEASVLMFEPLRKLTKDQDKKIIKKIPTQETSEQRAIRLYQTKKQIPEPEIPQTPPPTLPPCNFKQDRLYPNLQEQYAKRQQLIQKVQNDQGVSFSPNLTLTKSQSFNTIPFSERQTDLLKRKEQSKQKLLEEQRLDFKPKINQRNRSASACRFNQLYNQAKIYEENKALRKIKVMRDRQKECTFKPQLN